MRREPRTPVSLERRSPDRLMALSNRTFSNAPRTPHAGSVVAAKPIKISAPPCLFSKHLNFALRPADANGFKILAKLIATGYKLLIDVAVHFNILPAPL